MPCAPAPRRSSPPADPGAALWPLGPGVRISTASHGPRAGLPPVRRLSRPSAGGRIPWSWQPVEENRRMHRSPALQRPVVLGSTSRYRRELLQRLNLRFQVAAPAVDETPQPGEAPRALALRLALAKARAVAQQHPEAPVIGADQVADLAGAPLGKPGQHQRAVQQLRQMRGQAVAFQTAGAVVCAATGFEQWDLACVQVQFRALSDAEIERYLRAEQPYDCAGSAKSEGLGIALLDAIHSDDPTALMGLPLIRTCRMLRAAGLTLP